MQGKLDSSHSRSTNLVRLFKEHPGSRSRLLLDRQLNGGRRAADIHSLRGWLSVLAPSLQRVLSGRNVLDCKVAVLVSDCEIGSRSDDHITRHFRVHIAEE